MHSSLLPYIALCSDDAQEHALKLQKLLSDPEVSLGDGARAPNNHSATVRRSWQERWQMSRERRQRYTRSLLSVWCVGPSSIA